MKYYQLFIIFWLIFVPQINSQEQLEHTKKTYINEEGKFFIQKNLPIYLWLGTTRSEQNLHRLNSESAKEYTNPLYFDVEGLNTIKTPSAVDTVTKQVIRPQRDIIFEIYADSRPPVSRVKFLNTTLFWKNQVLFVGKDLKVELQATDQLSGCEQILYSINSQPYTKYPEPITFNENGEVMLKFYAVDNVGNAEKSKTEKFIIDTQSPISAYKIIGDRYNDILSARSSIAISAADNGSGVSKIFYKIDNGKELPFTGLISTNFLASGEHTLYFKAIDNVKNIEIEQAYKFEIDKTPPIIVEEVLGDSYFSNGREYSSGRSKVKLTAIDNKAGVKAVYYSLNRGEYLLYEKPFYLSTQQGNISIDYYAVDNVNNKSNADDNASQTSVSGSNSRFNRSFVDLTGPELKHQFIGETYRMRDTIFISPQTKVKLTGHDSESGLNKITYILDKEAEASFATDFQVHNGGLHHVDYFGYDNVSNMNRADFEFVVDSEAPEIFAHFSVSPYKMKEIDGHFVEVYPPQTVLFLAATDKLTGYQQISYSVNNAPAKNYTGIIADLQKGNLYSIAITAYDKVKNSSKRTLQFFIE